MKQTKKPLRCVVGWILVWSWCALAHAAPDAAEPAPPEASEVEGQRAADAEQAAFDVQTPEPMERLSDPFPQPSLAPVLLVFEGSAAELPVDELQRRLQEALGREIVTMLHEKARRAQATLWIGVGEEQIVVRVSPPQRADVWRRLLKRELGPDPVGAVVKAVLEMLWADAFARLDAAEIQDPFCPPGVICIDARRPTTTWPAAPEAEVVDPWDSSYRRFYGWDPYWRSGRYGSPWSPPPPPARPPPRGPGYRVPVGPGRQEPESAAPAPQQYAVGLLAGGGVHKGGAVLRYEINALRRFPRFDFGLAYIAARGQPEPFHDARRSVVAHLQRRFVSEEFELNLGASFGIFSATFDDRRVEVRPYLRGLLTFAMPIGSVFDLLVQSDLATTFASVPKTGAVEYGLSMGFRHRM